MKFKPFLLFVLISLLINCEIDRRVITTEERYYSPLDYLQGKMVLNIIINQDEIWFVSVTESDTVLPPYSSHVPYDMQLSLLKNGHFDYNDLSTDHIENIVFDQNGLIYATSNKKLLRIENLYTHVPIYEHRSPICTMAFDRQNNLWLGDYDNGLFVWDGTDWINYDTTNSSLPTNEIHSIVIDQNDVKWVSLGVDYNGLLRIEGDQWQYFKCSDLIGDEYSYFSNLVLDQLNQLWIGYQGQFLIYDGTDWSYSEPSIDQDTRKNHLRMLTSDHLGNIWVAYSDSYSPPEEVLTDIYCYDGNQWKKPVENFIGIVFDVELDTSNQLWIGAHNGLFQYQLLESN